MQTNDQAPEFFDERRLCERLGISSVTATKWRAKAKGPPFIKVGRLVRYRRTDVDAWLGANTVGAAATEGCRVVQGRTCPN